MGTRNARRERNYTVEFYRLMFCLSFAAIHVFQIYPLKAGMRPIGIWNLDTMLPFMAFSGFFLMNNFKRKQRTALEQNVAMPQPMTLAWQYLKGRLRGLMPIYLFGTLFGFVVKNILTHVPVIDWPIALFNGLPELFGIHVTGIGLGNNYVGQFVGGTSGNAGLVTMNGPLWFVSALFIAGFFVYFMLAWNEQLYLGIITPTLTVLLFATHHISGVDPTWTVFDQIGNFLINAGLLKMIALVSVGCSLWYVVDKYKDAKFTRSWTIFLTVIQTGLGLFMVYRTWCPYTARIGLDISFSSVYLLSLPFTLLVLLNKDGFTRFMNKKIWEYPGRLALYFYIIHFPIIGILFLYIKDFNALFVAVCVVSMLCAAILHWLDSKLLQPWLASVKLVES